MYVHLCLSSCALPYTYVGLFPVRSRFLEFRDALAVELAATDGVDNDVVGGDDGPVWNWDLNRRRFPLFWSRVGPVSSDLPQL